ncbi:type II toxin-antitoxin system HicA family toxin [Pseudorhizobium marinum]|uniref:type II toxin-antitoxin system HicA family toxin n=1 Tax=Pseudorhizobium marinum TaxID=1496690 RepID=UPI000496FD26|nr:type II toxin-antitoxin system HicA family toxin [Pseudorhizobium marinum]
MGGYLRELKDLLLAAGCTFVRPGKGDHEIWYSPLTKRHFTVDHGVKSRHSANETLKQAGLPKAF